MRIIYNSLAVHRHPNINPNPRSLFRLHSQFPASAARPRPHPNHTQTRRFRRVAGLPSPAVVIQKHVQLAVLSVELQTHTRRSGMPRDVGQRVLRNPE